VIKQIKKARPPMESEIGSELFKFARNVISHFPFFNSWNKVWINKPIVNWYREGLTIDKFLKKYEGHQEVKYRFWEEDKKLITYLAINFPISYKDGAKLFLKDMIIEKKGIKFCFILMKEITNSQVEEMIKLWCWRCKMEIPKLDEEEFKNASKLYGEAFKKGG